ncbi:MAG: molecular chaperone TorD family protein [Thiohalomonadales bacterium]|nr:molecular chaperone TorD family protein [Thiohalomonadales bacterium]
MMNQPPELSAEEMDSARINSSAENTAKVPFRGSVAHEEEQQYRAGAYSLLAALLRDVPKQGLLEHVTELAAIQKTRDELSLGMSILGLAAKDSKTEKISDEYHALFIGLGRGELVPYGSWYLTGFLMERPLAVLRDDLAKLGFERRSETHEPEDHVAALCEVMAMLINEGEDLAQQTDFFETHMSPWLDRFFADLVKAKSAVFYRAVGRFGAAFIELEKRYLAMTV